jgi:hypothetical protein
MTKKISNVNYTTVLVAIRGDSVQCHSRPSMLVSAKRKDKLASTLEMTASQPTANDTNLLKRGFGFGRRNLGKEGREWFDEIQKPYCGQRWLVTLHTNTFTIGTKANLWRRGECRAGESTYSHSLWRPAREERPSGKE